MKKLLMLCAILILCKMCNAQLPLINRWYDIGPYTDGSSVGVAEISNGYLFGFTFQSNIDVGAAIFKLDNYGDTLNSKYFSDINSKTLFGGFVHLSDGNYINSGGTFYDSSKDSIYALLVKISNLGDTLWTAKYFPTKDTMNAIVQSITPIESLNHNFFVGGFKQVSDQFGYTDNDLFIYGTDSLGHKLWDTIYSDNSVSRTILNVLKISDSTLLIHAFDIIGPNLKVKNLFLKYKCDGQFIEQVDIDSGKVNYASSIILSDHNALLSGAKYSTLPLVKGYLHKIKVDGTELWNKSIHFGGNTITELWSSREFKSGKIVSVGTTNFNFPGTGQYGLMTCVDSSGKWLWRNRFNFPDSSVLSFLYFVDEASDGGILATGNIWQLDTGTLIYSKRPWLLHLDANGCDSTHCPEILNVGWNDDWETTMFTNEFRAVPNPTYGRFKIIQKHTNDLEYHVFNSRGVAVSFEQISDDEIDITNSPSGLYLVQIIDGGDTYTVKVLVVE